MSTNSSERKRGFFEILAGILGSLTDGDLPRTHIVYSANLNFKRLPTYLATLEQLGLLAKIETSNGTKYKLTEKGNLFLKRYRDLVSLLKEEE